MTNSLPPVSHPAIQRLRDSGQAARLIGSSLLVSPGLAYSAAVANDSPGGFWEVIIGLFVCSVAASVAYLCYFAVRLWTGYWKALALAPLILLGLWLAFLLAVITTSLAPRPLWPVEILSWAMLTTVYLVVLFTARRTFDKAAVNDANSGTADPGSDE